jgi:hypothetical protein
MRILARLALGVALSVTAAFAADPAYVGKWKVNPAKSAVTGDTVTIMNAAGGMMQFNSQGFTYTFKTDGKEYPTPDGGTTQWKATTADTWDVTNRMKGKVSATYHLVVKGQTLSVSGKMMKPDNTSMDFSSTYKRIEGNAGFLGKWMSTDAKIPANTLEIAASGANGIALKDDTGPVASGQFDSKDNPAQGLMAGSKTTFAFRKISANAFEVTVKLDGKPMYVDVYSVSADGKTLTDDGTPSNAQKEKYKVVFDRQ